MKKCLVSGLFLIVCSNSFALSCLSSDFKLDRNVYERFVDIAVSELIEEDEIEITSLRKIYKETDYKYSKNIFADINTCHEFDSYEKGAGAFVAGAVVGGVVYDVVREVVREAAREVSEAHERHVREVEAERHEAHNRG